MLLVAQLVVGEGFAGTGKFQELLGAGDGFAREEGCLPQVFAGSHGKDVAGAAGGAGFVARGSFQCKAAGALHFVDLVVGEIEEQDGMQPLVPHIDGCQKGVVDHRQQFQRLDGWLQGAVRRLVQAEAAANAVPDVSRGIEPVKAGMNEVVAVLLAQALPFRSIRQLGKGRKLGKFARPGIQLPAQSVQCLGRVIRLVGLAGVFTQDIQLGRPEYIFKLEGVLKDAPGQGAKTHGQADYIRHSMMGAGVAVDRADSVIDACQQCRDQHRSAFRQQGVDAVSLILEEQSACVPDQAQHPFIGFGESCFHPVNHLPPLLEPYSFDIVSGNGAKAQDIAGDLPLQDVLLILLQDVAGHHAVHIWLPALPGLTNLLSAYLSPRLRLAKAVRVISASALSR